VKEKVVPGQEAHEFHWSMEGIRRQAEPEVRVKATPLKPSADDDAPAGAESRRYPRIDLTLPILYKILPEEPLLASQNAFPDLPTKVDNISPTGACLVLAEKLPKGTHLALSLHVAQKGVISAVGRVVWAKPTETAHHFLTGLEFVVVYRKTRTKTEYLTTDILKDLLDPT
jgi:hypothetical protein